MRIGVVEVEMGDGKGLLSVLAGGEMTVSERAATSVAKLASVAFGSATPIRVGVGVTWRAGASNRAKLRVR